MSDIDREEFPNATSESGGSLFSPENASPPLPLGGDLVSDPPLSSKGNGDRETNGRFRAGNRAARGNPLARPTPTAPFRLVPSGELRTILLPSFIALWRTQRAATRPQRSSCLSGFWDHQRA